MTPSGKVDRIALIRDAGNLPGEPRQRAAPSDFIEAQLIGLWGSVLGAHPDDVNQSFFDVGGHSLLAFKLFAEIERHLGVRMPVATIFRAPTVAELAAEIRQTGRVKMRSAPGGLIPLRTGGARRPVFFMPSFGEGEEARAGISIFHYRKLAARLGDDQPAYGMATVPEIRDMRSLAAHCARMIAAVQPHGPYILAGFCSDGEVAYAVARHLQSKGEEVAWIVVFDGLPPAASVPLAPGLASGDWRQKVRWALSWFRSGPAAAFERVRGRIARILDARSQRGDKKLPHPGRLLLFVSDETLAEYGDPAALWSDFVGSVESVRVAGDHFFLLKEPGLSFVARKLEEYLADPA
jgi:thioesterase domain-containing protein/acyl carrier protein